MSPPDLAVSRVLHPVRRRLVVREVLRTATVLIPIGAGLYVSIARRGVPIGLGLSISIGIVCVAAALWLRSRRMRWSAASAARATEAALPDLRNLMVTAEELQRHPARASDRIRQHVFDRAAGLVASSRLTIVSLTRDAIAAAGAVALAVSLVLGLPMRAVTGVAGAGRDLGSAGASSTAGLTIAVTVTPPAYSGRPAVTVENPERLDALEGSRLSLTMRNGRAWRARFGADVMPTVAHGNDLALDLTLTRSGYLAFERDDGGAGTRRLLPVTVIPDRAPAIQIESPGKDLLLPDAGRTISIRGAAVDDLGLRSLDLRYTKISGSGEQFEFQEGTLPLAITRDSGTAWKASGELALATLALSPGDSVVYRLVGRDGRPGDLGLASSDTFFVEVAGPAQVALEGFELPPDRERYALSQQMIVLKLERLRAREKSLERSALEAEVATIAAEQRAVKANFIFLTGGEVEDEEAEAEHSHEIQEGRLENTARQEISVAIQFMTRVEQALAAISTSGALPPARSAVAALQRAFGRNRYFLRTLPVRSRVDPSRRMTGELSAASDWQRDLQRAAPDAMVTAARTLLAQLLDASAAIRAGRVDAARLTMLAEDALAVNPGAADWQGISRRVLQLRDSDPAERSRHLTAAIGALSAITQRSAPAARPLDGVDPALRGAWSDEQRRK